MAASGAPARTLRRGPAPIASFDHDGSDESSPETKQTFRLPEIREDPASSSSLAPPERRARSHSTPAATAGLGAPAAPRIDISRASSSSHHDSRDSSPELALFAGGGGEEDRNRLELGFREDGALDLRSSTEELAFLEGAPGEPRPPAGAAAPPAARRHSRKDSQGSEAALLAVSGRTSRLSSVGSQCSAHSALSGFSRTSRVSRLSVASGASRSPSPHRMLLETSFCGPKPIETDPEICAAAVEERLLEIAKLTATSPRGAAPPPLDARDHREVRTEATVERDAPRSSSAPVTDPAPPTTASPTVTGPAPGPPPTAPQPAPPTPTVTSDDDKRVKETQNRARVQERRARPRVRREPSEPEVYKSGNRTKNIIRIKLKPDDEYEEDADETTADRRSAPSEEAARKPDSLEPSPRLSRAVRPTELVGRETAPASPLARRHAHRDSRTPSPAAGPPVSRKSSFCSLFKSRETIASPDSPSDALRRKRSLTEGRSRSKSRDRSATPSSAGKIKGSVLSLFRTPRRSAASPSPSSREGSPVVQPQRQIAPTPQATERARRGEKLKYYEDAKDGIIHIPLRTPPGDDGSSPSDGGRDAELERTATEVTMHRERPRPASAPQTRPTPCREPASCSDSAQAQSALQKPIHRTVLPDGSIIIPLRSPTERTTDERPPSPPADTTDSPVAASNAAESAVVVETVTDAPSPAEERPVDNVPEVARNDGIEAAPSSDEARRRRKERIVFTTHVGSREQVFSTQFSITKTPSVTSEISGSFPSFVECEEARVAASATTAAAVAAAGSVREAASGAGSTHAHSPEAGRARDSSESEPSSESGATRGGNDVERRGLVVQESFEEELPYVPTTLPLERSLALPMVPVRERGGVRVRGVERPRGAAPVPPPPAAPAPAAPRVPRPPPPGADAPRDKLLIRLPRRPRTDSVAAPTRTDRSRTRSASDGGESRPKTGWIDFEEVPERRKQPKRIQTLPAAGGGDLAAGAAAAAAGAAAAGGGVVFSYVEPEHCRCECHGHGHAEGDADGRDDELPLLLNEHHHQQQHQQQQRISPSSPECGEQARPPALRPQSEPDAPLQGEDHHRHRHHQHQH